MFPSPPGTSYFLMESKKMNEETLIVSVPSGDFLFFNSYMWYTLSTVKEVSVPSGDFLFFNIKRVSQKAH